jgi:hypothetical protein
MITTAPLPAWRDFAAVFARDDGTDDAELAAPWRRADEAAFWFSRAAFALAAVAHAEAVPAPSVWLPDYFCNQSTAPLRQSGAQIAFYPVGADLEPDWSACERLAAVAAPDLFILVHTFGRNTDGVRARAFCDLVAARLVEDAAHVVRPQPGVGEVGDFVIYSPQKVLAVPDGGLLLVRDSTQAPAIEAAIRHMGSRAHAPWTWFAKRGAQKILPPAAYAPLRRDLAFTDDPAYAPLPPTPALSVAARRLLARAPTTLPAAVLERRRNAMALRQCLAPVNAPRPFFRAEDEGPAPYRLVLDCANPRNAQVWYHRLGAAGVPVESWPDLAPEVTDSPQRHAIAIELRRRLVFVGIHQTLDMVALAKRFARAIG